MCFEHIYKGEIEMTRNMKAEGEEESVSWTRYTHSCSQCGVLTITISIDMTCTNLVSDINLTNWILQNKYIKCKY